MKVKKKVMKLTSGTATCANEKFVDNFFKTCKKRGIAVALVCDFVKDGRRAVMMEVEGSSRGSAMLKDLNMYFQTVQIQGIVEFLKGSKKGVSASAEAKN